MQSVSQFCGRMCLRWKTVKQCKITIHVVTVNSKDTDPQAATVSSMEGHKKKSSTLTPLVCELSCKDGFLAKSALITRNHVFFLGALDRYTLDLLEEKAKMTAMLVTSPLPLLASFLIFSQKPFSSLGSC